MNFSKLNPLEKTVVPSNQPEVPSRAMGKFQEDNDMKPLIRHLFHNNLEEILENSSANCHVRGLHSIMLLQKPGQSMRLYAATEDHELWRNGEEGIPESPMVAGFHPHHSNIMLHCVSGLVINPRAVVLRADGPQDGFRTRRLKRYRFDKSVEDKEVDTGFIEDGHDLVRVTEYQHLQPRDFVEMASHELHTISIPKGRSAAWFVYNGKEDPQYIPYLWTNTDLHKSSVTELYQPMSEEKLHSLLVGADLL